VTAAWTLFTTIAGAFLGYFFGYLARRADSRASTYDAAARLIAEFKTSLSLGKPPSEDFLTRTTYVGGQVADRFSKRGFRGWHQVQRLISVKGLKPGVQEYDFTQTADRALEILRKEMKISFRISRWLHRRGTSGKRRWVQCFRALGRLPRSPGPTIFP